MSEEEFDYDENIYQKLARATARAIDIKLGKTTLADLLDGYTKSRILQQKIDRAVEYINNRMVEEGEYYFRKAKHFRNTEYGKDLLGILKDNEQEEYTLTPDENGTTNINGVLYRVDKK